MSGVDNYFYHPLSQTSVFYTNTISPTGVAQLNLRRFDGREYLEYGIGQIDRASWSDPVGGELLAVCANPIDNTNGPYTIWQITYRNHGSDESISLLRMFLKAIQGYALKGWSKFDRMSEVANEQNFTIILGEIAATDQSLKDICVQLARELGIKARIAD